jgi:hypothetical protein
MGVRIKSLISAIALGTASSLGAIAVNAQETEVFRPRETVPNAMNRAFYGSMGEFSDRNPLSSVETIIGIPENRISRDGERVHRLYVDLMNQQVSSDPLIRTADLPNPFNLSVQTLPTSSSRMMGSEFAIERPIEAQAQPMMRPNPMLPQRY